MISGCEATGGHAGTGCRRGWTTGGRSGIGGGIDAGAGRCAWRAGGRRGGLGRASGARDAGGGELRRRHSRQGHAQDHLVDAMAQRCR